jgi:hypothetical protein
MKAVVMHEYGAPAVLKYEDFPDPVPGAGEVLIRVTAAGINPVDLVLRTGASKAYIPLEFPAILGRDLSGTVVKLGPGPNEFVVGDRVFAWAYHTYAGLCAVKAGSLAKIPDGRGSRPAACDNYGKPADFPRQWPEAWPDGLGFWGRWRGWPRGSAHSERQGSYRGRWRPEAATGSRREHRGRSSTRSRRSCCF